MAIVIMNDDYRNSTMMMVGEEISYNGRDRDYFIVYSK